jgi:sulfate adenylyltransferase subunit 2
MLGRCHRGDPDLSAVTSATVTSDDVLDALEALEAEAIHNLRETTAAFRNPVLMYSIGKDSSVLFHLARKTFFPGPIPMPFLHVDSQ